MDNMPYNRGWQANKDGLDRIADNPYRNGTSEAYAWESGWEDAAIQEEVPRIEKIQDL